MEVVFSDRFEHMMSKIDSAVTHMQDLRMIMMHNETWIAAGKEDNTLRREAVEERNIPILDACYYGGAIVVAPGDILFGELKNGPSNFGSKALHVLWRHLRSRGVGCRIFGNDLLAFDTDQKRWFKVASYGSGWVAKGYMQTGIHVSINLNPELISQVCIKDCQKTPGYLSQYGITAFEIYDVMKPLLYS